MPTDPWQNIPLDVLDDQRRADQAKLWGETQRRRLAADWAKLQFDDLALLERQYPAEDPSTAPPERQAIQEPILGGYPSQPAPSTTPDPFAGLREKLGLGVQADEGSLGGLDKPTSFQGSAGAMVDQGPYPGSLPYNPNDPNAGFRLPREQPPVDLIDRQSPDQPPNPPFTRLNLPGLPGMALPIAPIQPRPVPPSEEEHERVLKGEPFTPEVATAELGKFLNQQGGQQQPAGVMDVVFPEERAGQIVRYAESRGGRGGAVGGGPLRAMGEAAGGGGGADLTAFRRLFPEIRPGDYAEELGGAWLLPDGAFHGSAPTEGVPGHHDFAARQFLEMEGLPDDFGASRHSLGALTGAVRVQADAGVNVEIARPLTPAQRRSLGVLRKEMRATGGDDTVYFDVVDPVSGDRLSSGQGWGALLRASDALGGGGAAAEPAAMGAAAGLEVDDEGNVSFSPEKAAIGAAGGALLGSLGPASRYEPDPRDFSAHMQSRQGAKRTDIEGNVLPKSGSFKVNTSRAAEEAYYARKAAEDERGFLEGEESEALRAASEGDEALEFAPPAAAAAPPSPPKPPGPPRPKGEVGRLRLEKFPEAVQDTIQQAAEEGDFWRKQRRDVIPDAEAEEMADKLGRTVDQVIAKSAIGKAYNTEETRAVRNALVSQSVKVADLALAAAATPTKMTREAVAALIAEGTKLSDLSRIAEGARAEAGRTLRAYQAFARDYANDPAGAVTRIYRATAGDEASALARVDEFAKLVQQGADPFQMANFWSKVEKPPVTAQDWFRAIRYNSMLSGPRTMLVNAFGLSEAGWKLGRDVGASALSGDLRPLKPEVQGALAGVVKGLLGARQILAHGITREAAERGDLPRSLSSRLDNPVAKGAATALELPTRGMGAIDEVIRQIGYGMGKGRSAGIQASREGLSGRAWAKRVDELVAEQDKESVAGALAVADRMAFKGPMGHLGEDILLPAQSWSPMGVPLGNIVVPFLRSVYHITSRGIDRSPLGVLGTGVDVLRGAYKNPGGLRGALSKTDTEGLPKGVVPLGERLGDNLMGAVAFGGLSLYAAQGNITGKGPEDIQKRRLMEAEGWRPYSVKIGDEWVSYANWGPAAIPFSMAAALAEGEGEGPEWAYDVFTRGAGVLTEQSYLQGIGNIFKVLDQRVGGTYGEKMLEGTLQTLVPYGSTINTVGQATDPLVRAPEKGDVGAALQARFPGAREGVPAKQDVLGRDVENPQRGLIAAVPLRTSPVKKDSVVRALLDAGIDVPEPPKTVSHENVKDIPLTQADQREYRRIAGEELSKVVQRYVDHPKWSNGTQAQRAEVLQQALDAAREKAKLAVLKGLGKDEIKRRLSAATPPREVVGAGARP